MRPRFLVLLLVTYYVGCKRPIKQEEIQSAQGGELASGNQNTISDPKKEETTLALKDVTVKMGEPVTILLQVT